MTCASDATGPFHHGTRADLRPGDLLAPGFASWDGEHGVGLCFEDGRRLAAVDAHGHIPDVPPL